MQLRTTTKSLQSSETSLPRCGVRSALRGDSGNQTLVLLQAREGWLHERLARFCPLGGSPAGHRQWRVLAGSVFPQGRSTTHSGNPRSSSITRFKHAPDCGMPFIVVRYNGLTAMPGSSGVFSLLNSSRPGPIFQTVEHEDLYPYASPYQVRSQQSKCCLTVHFPSS
jgi:hypothetical protein